MVLWLKPSILLLSLADLLRTCPQTRSTWARWRARASWPTLSWTRRSSRACWTCPHGWPSTVCAATRLPSEWVRNAVVSWDVFCSGGGWSNLQRRAGWPLFLGGSLHSAALWYNNCTHAGMNKSRRWLAHPEYVEWSCSLMSIFIFFHPKLQFL